MSSLRLGFRLAASTSTRSSVRASWKQETRCATRRNIHQQKELPYSHEDGLGEFLPPPALKTVVEYQQGLLQKLNDEVRGTAEENKTIAQTVISTAMDRSKTLAFNYASLALNNSFFLEQLKPPPPPPATTHEASISHSLLGQLRFDHGSLDQFKSNFSAAALGMASSGWIWFVTDGQGMTAILPTFGSGTLLVRARMHVPPEMGKVIPAVVNSPYPPPPSEPKRHAPNPADELFAPSPDPLSPYGPEGSAVPLAADYSPHNRDPSSPFDLSPTSPTSGTSRSVPPTTHRPSQWRFLHSSTPTLSDDVLYTTEPTSIHSTPPQPDIANSTTMVQLGDVLYPLFCLSVHEHAWMSAGYGVWGKEEWLKKFWTVVDWGKVSINYGRLVDNKKTF